MCGKRGRQEVSARERRFGLYLCLSDNYDDFVCIFGRNARQKATGTFLGVKGRSVLPQRTYIMDCAQVIMTSTKKQQIE